MKIYYGPKGTGKTKSIIDNANEKVESAKGHVVFITDTNRYTYELKYQIRLLNVKKFEINNVDGFLGFVKGIVASNSDNEYIYIDGIARITEKPLIELESVFNALDSLEKEFGVNFVLTCSSQKEDLPDFILKHVE